MKKILDAHLGQIKDKSSGQADVIYEFWSTNFIVSHGASYDMEQSSLGVSLRYHFMSFTPDLAHEFFSDAQKRAIALKKLSFKTTTSANLYTGVGGNRAPGAELCCTSDVPGRGSWTRNYEFPTRTVQI
jgi:hypothetical protein